MRIYLSQVPRTDNFGSLSTTGNDGFYLRCGQVLTFIDSLIIPEINNKLSYVLRSVVKINRL